MRIQLRHKVIGLAIFSSLLPALLLTGLILYQKPVLTKGVNQEVTTLLKATYEAMVQNVYASFETANDLVSEYILGARNVARHILEDAGQIELGEELVEWEAINQFTKEKKSIALPRLNLGGRWIGKHHSFDETVPLVDAIVDLVGGTATIFQKIDAEGAMLRVATNVKTEEGERAIGTFIPAKKMDGTNNDVIEALMKGESYQGVAFVVNDWYFTNYDPIKNQSGELIGALYVGVKQRNIETLTKAIEDIKVGENGYVWVLRGEEDEKKLILKSENLSEENILKGEPGAVYTLLKRKVLEGSKGEVLISQHIWRDFGEEEVSEKTIAALYFKPWDWVIGITAYNRDFAQPYHRVEAAFSKLTNGAFLLAGCTLVIAAVSAFYFGARIARPITAATEIATEIANGNVKIDSTRFEDLEKMMFVSGDETDHLFKAIMRMSKNLDRLIEQIRKSSNQLITTSDEIATTLNKQENTISAFGGASNAIAIAVEEISNTAQELYKTMRDVSDVANETGTMAGVSLGELAEMQKKMDALLKATASISKKLSAINDKAGNISRVISTISEVATQTNLLSLNAAIEAENAGEYGVGFAVVAKEIRRLADQTADATLDVEQMVKEMQVAVGKGVNEMSHFSLEVSRGVEEVERVSENLQEIIAKVRELSPRFLIVRSGMESQSQGAQKINEAMGNLTNAAEASSGSLEEFHKVMRHLLQAAGRLGREISIFQKKK